MHSTVHYLVPTLGATVFDLRCSSSCLFRLINSLSLQSKGRNRSRRITPHARGVGGVRNELDHAPSDIRTIGDTELPDG